MKKLSISITLIGLFLLILLLNFQNPIKIHSQQELSKLTPNQKVQVEGKVISQLANNQNTILTLENNLTLIYSGPYFNFLNKKIEAIGIYDNFNYGKIKILKINIFFLIHYLHHQYN